MKMVPVLLSIWQMEPAVCRLKISLRHTDSITNRENLSDHSPSFAIVIHRPLARLLSASHSVRARRASMMQESCKSVIKTRCETLTSERKKWSNISELIWHVFLGFVVFLKKRVPCWHQSVHQFPLLPLRRWAQMNEICSGSHQIKDTKLIAYFLTSPNNNCVPKTRFLKSRVFYTSRDKWTERQGEGRQFQRKTFFHFQYKLHFFIQPLHTASKGPAMHFEGLIEIG